MDIELRCPVCNKSFRLSPTSPVGVALTRLTDEDRGNALGDGRTVEDMLFAALSEQGATHCPKCGEPIAVTEETLHELALEFLASW
jgi:hypothetical protein